jgi:hypothetical protein
MMSGDEPLKAKAFVDHVRTENIAFYSSDLGQGALKDLQQTFPHPWLYVGELLQNAVDAGAKKIRLAAEPGSSVLVFEHDGAAFEESHVRGLCSRGMSTKGAGNVGFMGIGFKAVFQSFESVDVSSAPWRFRLCVKEEVGEYGDRQRDWLGCVSPAYVDSISDPSPGMHCRFILQERLERLGAIDGDIAHLLAPDLLVLGLLARRGVQGVEWNDQRWALSQSETILDDTTTRVILDALDETTSEVRQWILFSATYQPSREAIARFLEHRQIRPKPPEKEKVYGEARRRRSVEVFCPLDQTGTPLPPRRGQAHALLPTGNTVPMGLHVQADWLLNTSRRELMEVETNAWHQEILARLAGLLRAYLDWLTTLPTMSERRLAESYAVLPAWDETEGAFVTYLGNPSFRDGVRAALSDLAFLPVRRDDGIRFVPPGEAMLLPSALQVFDDNKQRPWELFGGDVISTGLLGVSAKQSLAELGLLRPLGATDLVARWDEGEVGRWRESLGERAAEAHHRLLNALASLDGEAAWRDAPLRCLPAASGAWIDRHSAVGLPSDWDSVPEEDPPLRSWLEPFLAPNETRVDWPFDRALQRDANARQYVASLARSKTDEILNRWWNAFPTSPDDGVCALVLDVTSWVRSKRRQQPGLVTRVLCDAPSGTVLVPLSEAVLAEPYASGARRRFFEEYPPVSGMYLNHEPGVSDADWRSFFEQASDKLKGPLRLTEKAKELSARQVGQALQGYSIPSTKSLRMTARWRNVSFSSDNYLLVDAALPSKLQSMVSGSVSAPDAQAVAQWLHEARQDLPSKKAIRVVYVPYNSSSPYQSITRFSAAWVGVINEAHWVYDTDGNGPYAPSQLLARADIARPDVPVARLPEDLVATLEDCDITFGTSVPEVAAIERLRREGPFGDADRLLHLVQQAIEASEENPEHRAELVVVLRTVVLVPVPVGARPIDNAARIGANRFVLRSVRGAELGGWLVAVDTLTRGQPEDDALVQLVKLIASLCALRDAPTWEQALAFLEWVWQSRPDAELVRRILPRAYRIIADELNNDPGREEVWGAARGSAIVYVASRKWVSVTSEHLFLDDLGDDRLKGIVDGLQLATPGHLGETPEDQRRVATLLGIQFLSNRFQVTLETKDKRPLPPRWTTCLEAIFDLLQTYVREEQGNDEPTTRAPLVTTYYAQLRKVLIDNGVQTGNWNVYAARDEHGISLTGDPDDFAADLCLVLLQWAGLDARRDLGDIAPTITQLICWFDRPDKFARRLTTLGTQRGGVTPPPPSAPVPTDEPVEPLAEPTSEPEPEPEREPAPTPLPTSEPPQEDEPPSDEKPPAEEDEPVPPMSGGYTPEQREGRLKALLKQRDQIDKQIEAGLGVSPLPEEPPEPDDDVPGTFASDVQYRAAVVEYERLAGRYAETKDANQPGYDIDSFDRPLDDPDKLLVRRIEVKGHGCPWDGNLTVALSNRQFIDAYLGRADGIATGEDFDYWLYVVERQENGLHVLPIRNPSRRAAKFEFRGGTWRSQAQRADERGGDVDDQ